jgi:hypothetical protein
MKKSDNDAHLNDFLTSRKLFCDPTLIFTKENLGVKNLQGETFLHIAVGLGLISKLPAELFQEKYWDLKTSGRTETVYHIAAEYNQLKKIHKKYPKFLKNIDLYKKSTRVGITPFMRGCEELENIKDYPTPLIRPEDFNTRTRGDDTALHLRASIWPEEPVPKAWLTPERLMAINAGGKKPLDEAIDSLMVNTWQWATPTAVLHSSNNNPTALQNFIVEHGLEQFIKKTPTNYQSLITFGDLEEIRDKNEINTVGLNRIDPKGWLKICPTQERLTQMKKLLATIPDQQGVKASIVILQETSIILENITNSANKIEKALNTLPSHNSKNLKQLNT